MFRLAGSRKNLLRDFGGMPELLATGTRGETALVIPAAITFNPGSLYRLWLVALTGKGHGEWGRSSRVHIPGEWYH